MRLYSTRDDSSGSAPPVHLADLATAIESLDVAIAFEGQHTVCEAIQERAGEREDAFRSAGGQLQARRDGPYASMRRYLMRCGWSASAPSRRWRSFS
jgi:hypothetical protein